MLKRQWSLWRNLCLLQLLNPEKSQNEEFRDIVKVKMGDSGGIKKKMGS